MWIEWSHLEAYDMNFLIIIFLMIFKAQGLTVLHLPADSGRINTLASQHLRRQKVLHSDGTLINIHREDLDHVSNLLVLGSYTFQPLKTLDLDDYC